MTRLDTVMDFPLHFRMTVYMLYNALLVVHLCMCVHLCACTCVHMCVHVCVCVGVISIQHKP